jgi:hypothetical protein
VEIKKYEYLSRLFSMKKKIQKKNIFTMKEIPTKRKCPRVIERLELSEGSDVKGKVLVAFGL